MNRRPSDTLALILGAGVILVLIVLAATALIDSTQSGGQGTRPSENLTQILATILGGIVGALGAYLGRSSLDRGHDPEDDPPEVDPLEEREPRRFPPAKVEADADGGV